MKEKFIYENFSAGHLRMGPRRVETNIRIKLRKDDRSIRKGKGLEKSIKNQIMTLLNRMNCTLVMLYNLFYSQK